jgi:flagellar hook-length control protein FliK
MLQTTFGVTDAGLGGMGGASRSGENDAAGDDGLFATTLDDQRNQFAARDQSPSSAKVQDTPQKSDAAGPDGAASQSATDEASTEGAEEKTPKKQDVDEGSSRQAKKSDEAAEDERTAKKEGAKKASSDEDSARAKTDKERSKAELALVRQITAGKKEAEEASSHSAAKKDAAALLHAQADEKGEIEKAKGDSKGKKDGKELPVALPLSIEAALPKQTAAAGHDGKKASAGKAHVAQSALGAIHEQSKGDGKELSQKILEQIKGSVSQSGGGATAKASADGAAKGATDFLRTLQVVTPKDGAQAGVQPTATGMSPTQAQPAAASTPAANMTLPTPVGEQDWDKGLGDRLVWMVKGGVQEAKLQLTPRHLGPIDIKVSLHQDQASVSFTAHNPHTREALESAMPRLREMMSDQGLNLAQSDVSQHQAGQQQQPQDGGAGSGQGGPGGDVLGGGLGEEVPEGAVTGETTVGLGALDYYA